MRLVALVAVKRERGGGRWVYRVPFYEYRAVVCGWGTTTFQA